MPRGHWANEVVFFCFLVWSITVAIAQPSQIQLTVNDENGVAVSGAQVVVSEPGLPPLRLTTDYAGRCQYSIQGNTPYEIDAGKPGFYQTLVHQVDPHQQTIELVLAHQQMVRQQVNVVASTVGIDPDQTSDVSNMSTPEIVSIPYQPSRDIRNLLPFNPGVVQDDSGQVHVAGSQTFATLDLLDGFDIRSPVSGTLSLRVSPDVVRSIDVEKTRYPVEYGKATGGVIAFRAGMGDNRFRYNATDFFPSYREVNGGIHFDKFVPRLTFTGPIVKNKAWFSDGIELEYDNIIIAGLPTNADSNQLWRGSNLAKAQVNVTPSDIVIGGLLFNDYHSPYDGLSTMTPQESTINQDILAWFPYVREQHSFAGGELLDLGVGAVRFRDGYEPHGDTPFEVTPETYKGSFFEAATGISRRVQGTAALYLLPRQWAGRHDVQMGLDIDQINFGETVTRTPISYLREDGTLLRLSTFPAQAPFNRNNFETGAYIQDRWFPRDGLLVESGLRFDWDEIVRRPVYSPRIAATWTPSTNATTKLSAGVGLYYEHTQLQYLEESLAGIRYDTYYALDGVTPISPPLLTIFVANNGLLHEPRTVNWSLGIEHKLPAAIYASVNYLNKHGTDAFVYDIQSPPPALYGTYLLNNSRTENYYSVDFSLRHTFAHGYVLFGSYTRSSAHTNAAVEYSPTLSELGPQASGPLPWDAPNRVLSWGWLPVPKLKNWDFVYTADWRTGFPYTSVNANQQAVGEPNSRRFPDYLSLSPGLEWRFHFRGYYFGLRGVIENITDSQNPAIVNNDVDSPQYGTFSVPQGRAFNARIRLISSK
ncbi:MAG TPA: hypothetical protein VMA71_07105 [Alloacidobacterium sp.]|nr:hypothetical protein [Alloacidobacterium sp.]